MQLSVIIPVFNQRPSLARCLDALENEIADEEIIVVNGPSTDGTSGMVHERTDVDVLVELSSRNVNVARNVGIRRSQYDGIVLFDPQHLVNPTWATTIRSILGTSADAISGPVTTETPMAPFDGSTGGMMAGNLAVTRDALIALDGFDEYLTIGGTADFERRFGLQSFRLVWDSDMRVDRQHGDDPKAAVDAWLHPNAPDWGTVYRSRTYRALKNDGLRPVPIGRLLAGALLDGIRSGQDVLRGNSQASWWYQNGWAVVRNVATGAWDGLRAQRTDRSGAGNPHGLSQSIEEAVVVDEYDWRVN